MIVFGVLVNVLMLSAPLYMLQIYDRVLRSQSEPTLVALTALLAFFLLIMGILDHARGRVIARLGLRFQARMDRRVFVAALRVASNQPGDPCAITAQRDVQAITTLLSSPVMMALFDALWTPIFIAGLFMFHPWLGILAIAGGGVLVSLAVANKIISSRTNLTASFAAMTADKFADQLKADADIVEGLGMMTAGFERWNVMRRIAISQRLRYSDLSGTFSTATKTFRFFLQSAMLGLGALLVLRGMMSAGAMIAGSVLLGRALAPLEMVIGQWALVSNASQAWQRLAHLLSSVPAERPRLALPRPTARLDVNQITVLPPGTMRAALRMVSFSVEPGQAIGVIGPSGAGKSSLSRALTGIWSVAAGDIRLGGATLQSYDQDVLGRLIGYLPQHVTLFDGSIAENIARFDRDPESGRIIAAARNAAAHDLILSLPDGYDTPVGSGSGGRLSGGQIQRIGLARALYGDPVLLILDEPNSNLDNEGSAALNAAIRAVKADGRSVLIMAHRPAAIQECDLLLVIENGMQRAFGPRDAILRDMIRNHAEIRGGAVRGGVA